MAFTFEVVREIAKVGNFIFAEVRTPHPRKKGLWNTYYIPIENGKDVSTRFPFGYLISEGERLKIFLEHAPLNPQADVKYKYSSAPVFSKKEAVQGSNEPWCDPDWTSGE